MRQKMVWLLTFSIMTSSCVHQAETPLASADSTVTSPKTAFATFVDEYFEASFVFSPSSATATGIHTYDDKLENRSSSALAKRLLTLKDFQQRLNGIQSTLFDEQIDIKAMQSQIQSEIFAMESLRVWQNNPMSYASLPGSAVDSLIKRNFAPAQERLLSVIARLQGIPALYAAARENLENPPKEFTDLAMRMAQGSVGYFELSLPIWAASAAGSDQALLLEFQAANRLAIAEARQFALWLKQDLLPRSKGSYAIGEKAFSQLLLYNEMVETPLAELLKIGEAQLQKDYEAFVATARLIDPKKTPAQVMKLLSDEHPKANDLIPSVRRTVEEARSFLIRKDIITVPSEVRPRIEETPAYDRSGTFASMDTPGPEETKATEAYYYVTPVEASWSKKHQEEHLRGYNPYVVSIINVHEAFPGHYLQFLYASKYPTKTRKMISSSSNAEGWAHYTEQMMVEEGFGDGNPKIRLAQLQEALLRDCRFIAGIKLHTQAWTVEQGARLFETKGFQEPANAFEEARRGTYNPTYLYYTLGKIEIQKLRDDYLRQTGKSLKQFHDAFVTQGALPIPLVREILLNKPKT